jgi:hypothetical protein
MVRLTERAPDVTAVRGDRVLVSTSLLLCAAAVALTWIGSADPPIDIRNSAYWSRTLNRVPGLLDTCRNFTWAARAVPPVLAAVGGGVALLATPRSRLSIGSSVAAFALSAALLYATLQNAVPWGEVGCVIN